MRVCFITGTLGLGGAEKQLLYMAEALRDRGAKVSVLCLTEGEPYQERLQELGIEVFWVGRRRSRFARLLEIIRQISRVAPDVIQSSHFYTNIYAGVTGRILGIPSIGAVRSNFDREVALHGMIGGFQARIPHLLVVNSKAAIKNARRSGIADGKLRFLANVVSAVEDRARDGQNRRVSILFVGRLDENKRPGRFVRLAAAMKDRCQDLSICFRVAGDGVLGEEIRKRAIKAGLDEEYLRFYGPCRDMDPVYREADILVSTSAREGTPNVILEAMAYGLPVVATNVGGVAEILNENTGILVDPEDDEELFRSVRRLVLDEGLRRSMGGAGAERIRKHHSIEGLGEMLIGIYGEICNPAKVDGLICPS